MSLETVSGGGVILHTSPPKSSVHCFHKVDSPYHNYRFVVVAKYLLGNIVKKRKKNQPPINQQHYEDVVWIIPLPTPSCSGRRVGVDHSLSPSNRR